MTDTTPTLDRPTREQILAITGNLSMAIGHILDAHLALNNAPAGKNDARIRELTSIASAALNEAWNLALEHHDDETDADR